MTRAVGTELYEAFVAVAELSGFTRAAERLHRSQNTVSHQVRKLEAALDCTLFRRTSRRVELTAAGQALLPCARSILRLHERAGHLAWGAKDEGVRIGLPDRCVDLVVPQLVDTAESLTQRAPIIHCGRSPTLCEWFLNNDLDIVLSTQKPEQAIGYPVITERLVWANRVAFDAHDERVLPLILGPEDCPHRALAVAALTETGIPFEVVHTAITEGQLKRAAALGRGLTVLPADLVGPELVEVGAVAQLPEIPPPPLDLYFSESIVERRGSAFAERILVSVVEGFGNAGYGEAVRDDRRASVPGSTRS